MFMQNQDWILQSFDQKELKNIVTGRDDCDIEREGEGAL